jgi:hypothetical protein
MEDMLTGISRKREHEMKMTHDRQMNKTNNDCRLLAFSLYKNRSDDFQVPYASALKPDIIHAIFIFSTILVNTHR